MEVSDALRGLPQVDRLIEAIGSSEPHALKAAAARRVVAEARTAVRGGAPAPSLAELAAAAGRLLEEGRRRRGGPLLNATRVLLHTHPGRGPPRRGAVHATRAGSRGGGTTTPPRLRDSRAPIGDATAALMKVPPSTSQVVGFVKPVPPAELAELAHSRGLPLIHDVGSGLLRRRIGGYEPPWLAAEPAVEEALAEGADVVTFSGDKLLGGPQAGIICGRAEAVAAMERSPLLRTYRVDKTTLAALEATLLVYLQGREADLPLWKMALAEASEIESRAGAVRAALGAVAAKVELGGGNSTTGGGSAPGCRIPTVLLEIAPRDQTQAEVRRALVDAEPPVIARVEEDRLVLDLRTVAPEQDTLVAEVLRGVLA